MAGHIVPLDAVVVEIVQNGQAGFIIALQMCELIKSPSLN